MPDARSAARGKTQQLPADIVAEANFLAAVLADNEAMKELDTPLSPSHFVDPYHATVFRLILENVALSVKFAPATLHPYFEAHGIDNFRHLIRSIAGQQWIAPRKLAERIYELALMRELVALGCYLAEAALDTSEDIGPFELIKQTETALYVLAEGGAASREALSFSAASRIAFEMLEKGALFEDRIPGKATGLNALDDQIGGLGDGELILLASPPRMGKTSLATSIAFQVSNQLLEDMTQVTDPDQSRGAAVAFFSLKLSAEKLAFRILAQQAGVSAEASLALGPGCEDFQRVDCTRQRLDQLPLFIDDTPGISITDLCKKARRLKRRHDIGLIVVDGLQMVQGTGASDNWLSRSSEVSRGLKVLAKELSLPVIATFQVSREIEVGADDYSYHSRLQEMGIAGVNADMIWFLSRVEKNKSPEDLVCLVNTIDLHIVKPAHGVFGTLRMLYDVESTRFTDLPLKVGEHPVPDG